MWQAFAVDVMIWPPSVVEESLMVEVILLRNREACGLWPVVDASEAGSGAEGRRNLAWLAETGGILLVLAG